jgi:hypothetical protein
MNTKENPEETERAFPVERVVGRLPLDREEWLRQCAAIFESDGMSLKSARYLAGLALASVDNDIAAPPPAVAAEVLAGIR